MTSSTLEAGEDSQREDFVGCERGAQAPVIDMGTLNFSLTGLRCDVPYVGAGCRQYQAK
jgi:hypothetical protein